MKSNRIPRTATHITAKMLTNTSASKAGDICEYFKTADGWKLTAKDGTTYHAFIEMLRTAEVCEILAIS